MKKFLTLIFSSALILGACGNDDTPNKDSDTKSESKTEKKTDDKKIRKLKKIKSLKKKRNLKKMKIASLHKKTTLLKNQTPKKLPQMNKFNLNNLQLKSNNKLNKTANTIVLNTVMNTTLVIRFQLMMIGHPKNNKDMMKV